MHTNPTFTSPTAVLTCFNDSTPLLGNSTALRTRAEEDGFLYFRSFLPSEPLLELRKQILEIVESFGWIKSGSALMEGVADLAAIAASDARDKSLYAIGVTAEAYREIQRLELFHALPHHPRLIALYEQLFGTDVLPHPRHIARVLLPSPSFSPTPPHQDYFYIHGTHRFWTCWFPLGDVPLGLGGLSILKGSHREPILEVTRARGAGGFEAILCGKDYTWVQGDYYCGDIITFPSHTVHKGLPNALGNKIRLSCDIRYQPADEEIEQHSLYPHMKVASWEELYQGWKDERFKYYWLKHKLKLSQANRITERDRPC